MKTQIITLLWCCFSILGFSQSITEIEYFYNTDPGFDNATSITADVNTGNLNQTVSIPIGSLTGFNSFYFRVKDNSNIWSMYEKRSFYVTDFTISGGASNIASAEYFFNTDPGFGNANALTTNLNTGNLSQTFSIAIGASLTGFNTLYIRTQDDLGVWSMYEKRTFYITDFTISGGASNIATAEYFFNTDPGFGNANALTVNANTGDLTQTIALPVGTLEGFNTMYIRTQDDLGVWSMYERKTFFVFKNEAGAGATNIAEAEYFIDTDPGFGNGTAITVDSNTGLLNQTISIPTSPLEGFHNLYVRVRDDIGIWSLYEKKLFYVNKDIIISPITAAEYFYDTDPGFGNGTAASIIPTGNPDEYTIDLATTDVTCDFHDFYIRLQNADGKWSLYELREDVEVFDNADPTIVVFPNITAELDASGQASITLADVDDGTFDDCELVSVVLNQTQFDYTCANLGANTVTITATDAEAKVSTEDVTITVVDNINPVAISQNITVQLDATGNVSITPSQIENGSSDNCAVTGFSLDVSSFTCANLGANTVNLTVSDSSGNTNSTSATVTVEDSVKPTVTTQASTVQLDASGNATIMVNDVDNGSTDNCTIANRSIDITSFTCADLGNNTVTLTITDQSGNIETGTATITVEDNINPTVVTQNLTVQLDATGNASITASQIENGSTDNCAIASNSLDITSFTCADLGANTVTLSVNDTSGNTGTNTATVTVEDNINPVAITQAFTAQLDASGNVTINADNVDNNSTDNCGVTSKSLDVSSFTCADLGANTVMLTVEDANGNSNTASATVTVVDSVNPSVVTQNLTVQLDATGNASITASQIENGSTDNCAIASNSLDITSFTCADLGANTVTLSVNDTSGNTGTNTATVTVEDNINPVAVTQAFTAQLDASGNVTINADNVDNNSTDNCGVTSKSLDVSSFTCADLGANTVMLTVEDANGNSNTASATVTVVDSVNPVAIGQDINIDLAGNPSITITANNVDNGSSDNCGFTLSIDVDTFTTPGNYPVVLTITDDAGNMNSTTVTVTIIDTLSIEDVEISARNIKLYPVPTESYLNISTKLVINTLSIYSINGKLLKRIKTPKTKINLSNLSAGIYFLKFNIDNVSVTKQVIKK
ncbi:hypothetical protein GCM10023311_21960 [Flaviramulus aquimarinus]|uniref:Secretion system C-terminal sorting domain-containing protein n=1 Tax=Flaviramulus aquimarinus TaxID=1170456 RepID=A0ABP9FAX1_9FLAO